MPTKQQLTHRLKQIETENIKLKQELDGMKTVIEINKSSISKIKIVSEIAKHYKAITELQQEMF